MLTLQSFIGKHSKLSARLESETGSGVIVYTNEAVHNQGIMKFIAWQIFNCVNTTYES